MHFWFVCSENRLRSPTAKAIFSEYENVEAIGAETNADAETPVSGDLTEWADIIFLMEQIHKTKISGKYKDLLKRKRLVVLDIPDNYVYMQSELIQVLKAKVKHLMRLCNAKGLVACFYCRKGLHPHPSSYL